MTTESESCTKCGKPQRKQQNASLTQWLFRLGSCRCDLDSIIEAEKRRQCAACGLPIYAEKAGSITQWIFQPQACKCSEAQSAPPPAVVCEDLKVVQDGELQLSPLQFPTQRYQPIREIGKGSAGIVYLASDRLLNKLVAVKVLHSLTADQLISFQTEARAISRLDHPNIVKLLDFGPTESGGVPYMVLEYFSGTDLKQHLQEHGALDTTSAITIFSSIAEALTLAHALGVYHRDLNPSNILLDLSRPNKPSAKLIDFGVAELLETKEKIVVQGRSIVGVPQYMSPDVVSGGSYDCRSEVYSLGCLLFEALAGKVPFLGRTALETLNMHAHDLPPTLRQAAGVTFSLELEGLVAKCLAKAPHDRFQKMDELRETLLALDCSTGALPGDEEYDDARPSGTQQAVPLPGRSGGRPDSFTALFFLVSLLVVSVSVFLSRSGSSPTVLPANQSTSTPDRFQNNAAVPETDAARQKRLERLFKISGRNWQAQDRVRDADLQLLPPLHSLVLADQHDITDGGCRFLAKLPLYGLDIAGTSIGDTGLREISRIKTLKYLNADQTAITGSGLQCLTGSQLKSLSLSGTAITDQGLRSIAGMNELKKLFLENTNIGDEGLFYLRHTRLDTLYLTNTKVTNKGLTSIGRLPLENLGLSGCSLITDEGLRCLGAVRTLRYLHIAKCRIGETGIKSLSGLPLSHLYVDQCKGFTDGCLEVSASNWPNLRQLGIFETKVTGQGLKSVEKFQDLESCSVARLSLTDADVYPIFKLRRLKRIDLSGNAITDRTLQSLAGMPELEKVLLFECRNVTANGIEKLSHLVETQADVVPEFQVREDFKHLPL